MARPWGHHVHEPRRRLGAVGRPASWREYRTHARAVPGRERRLGQAARARHDLRDELLEWWGRLEWNPGYRAAPRAVADVGGRAGPRRDSAGRGALLMCAAELAAPRDL